MIHDVKIDVTRQRLYLDDNVTYGRAVTYGSGSTMRDMRMTLIRHRTGTGIKYPVIIFLCGGGWVSQDYNAHVPELFEYAEAGYVVASVEYRLAGESVFPQRCATSRRPSATFAPMPGSWISTPTASACSENPRAVIWRRLSA
jgi:hypothetical protein